MNEYDFKAIEAKWQNVWDKEEYGKSEDFSEKPKFYSLIEFPYPSGSGLHVGHCMMYSAADAHARMMRMKGYNLMFPMGWDAFGLPTENYAIKNKVKPQTITEQAIATFKKQQKSIGYSFDWAREINTTDPNYYKWTQWIFLQFYKHGIIDNKLIKIADNDKTTPRLAFQQEMPVNWCPSCKIVLANEEVVNNACERCGTTSEKRKQKQWMLRITAYADRLIDDLKTVDYLDKIKTQQINWIGKSIGSDIDFKIKDSTDVIRVFTTRADTLFGCTYIVLAPEHSLIENLKSKLSNWSEVQNYINDAKKKSDIERAELEKDKTGVKLEGLRAINPINNEEVDIYIADYVLASYGTGAVMAVPAHDDRDFEFAKKYGIEIKYVIEPKFVGTTGDGAVKADLPFVKRNAVVAVVHNPINDKYLCISWKNFKMHGLVTGGIEDNEDIIEAAKREVLEETGYKNLKYIRTAPLAINTQFYHRVKQENRWAHFKFVFFNLENDEQSEIDKKEKSQHDFIWKSKNELKDFFTVFEGIYLTDLLSKSDIAFTEYGILVNSDGFDGLTSDEAKTKITEKLKKDGLGDFSVNYKLRDWIFSRQHYWGEPIPIVHCDKCGAVPIPEDQLPVTLPEVENYEPTDSGESPLSAISDWVNVTCPICGGKAKRETDTMPNWAGSSWYYLRYCDPKNNEYLADRDKLNYWTPIDLYNGGPEHITLHLLYSRFWHKFLYDLDVAPTAEPYQKRIQHGIILGPDGQKMSKSKGNVINPDEMVEKFGADTLRAYIMFIGPYDQESAWNMAGIQGVYRFLKRVWLNQTLVKDTEDSTELLVKLNQTVLGVTEDLESFHMNTVISKLMELNNTIEKIGSISKSSFNTFLQILFPACPHISSELWQIFNQNDESIEKTNWPKPDENYLVNEKIKLAVQINGKTRQIISISPTASQEEAENMALNDDKIKTLLNKENIVKTIYVAGRILNFVVK